MTLFFDIIKISFPKECHISNLKTLLVMIAKNKTIKIKIKKLKLPDTIDTIIPIKGRMVVISKEMNNIIFTIIDTLRLI